MLCVQSTRETAKEKVAGIAEVVGKEVGASGAAPVTQERQVDVKPPAALQRSYIRFPLPPPP